MTLAFRPFLTAVFALVLVLTSLQMAMARGAPQPAGTMVICSGQGILTLEVDEDGNPTGSVHICPECALALFSVVETPQASVEVALVWTPLILSDAGLPGLHQVRLSASARGPPLSV